MTTQNRQKSNAKKQTENLTAVNDVVVCFVDVDADVLLPFIVWYDDDDDDDSDVVDNDHNSDETDNDGIIDDDDDGDNDDDEVVVKI